LRSLSNKPRKTSGTSSKNIAWQVASTLQYAQCTNIDHTVEPKAAVKRDRTVIVKWKRKVRNYDPTEIEKIFSKYGEVDLVMSKGKCLLSFKNDLSAVSAGVYEI
jgi:hypothetical protein